MDVRGGEYDQLSVQRNRPAAREVVETAGVADGNASIAPLLLTEYLFNEILLVHIEI